MQATDPALARLRMAWRMLVVFTACLAVGYGMARAMGQASVFGLTYGGMVGLIVGLTIAGSKAGMVAVRCVWGVPVFLVALFCAIEVEPYRVVALILAAVAVLIQLSAEAFLGEFGHDAGVMLFAGFLGGVLVPLPLSMMKYIAPIVAVAAVTAAVVQVVLCRMQPATGLVHLERAFLARTRYVVRRAVRLVADEDGTARATRKLCDEMVHLNEAAMHLDGYLPSSGRPGEAAVRLHRLVFDTELAAHALGRTVLQLCRRPLPYEVRTHLLEALAGLDCGGRRHRGSSPVAAGPLLEWLARHEDDSHDPEHEQFVSTLYRFAAVLSDLHRASAAWTAEPDGEFEQIAMDSKPFTSSVELVKGKLPGTSLLVSRVLASGGMPRPWHFWSNPDPDIRIAIQVLSALAIAIPLGDALDGYRFYWAIIGALIVMIGTDSTHARLRKAVKRVVGTLIGGVVGIGAAHLLGHGHPTWTLTVLCAAMVIGAYAITSYYAVWAGCLCFALIQLYAYTTGYEDSVIVLRAGENALGAIIATVVGLVVLPIATRTLLRRAHATHMRSLATFVRESGEVWCGSAGAAGTREHARAVDQANYELHKFTGSLLRLPYGARRERSERIRSMLRTAAVCAREMSVGSGEAVLTPGQRAQLLRITGSLSASIDSLAVVVSDNEKAAQDETEPAAPLELWVRHAEEIRQLQTVLAVSPANARLQHALHYLGFLDDLLGDLASELDIPVQGNDYRTSAPAIGRELFARHAQLVSVGQSVPASGPGRRARAEISMPTWPSVDVSLHDDGRWIGGYALGDSGRPVPGALLTLIDQRGHQVSRATGKCDGSYRIDVREAGSYVLIVSASGYGPVAVTVNAGSLPQRHDVTLLSSGEVSGVVYRADRGEPIADATVTLTDTRGEVVGATISGEDGAYMCRGGLEAGNYTLVATAEHMRTTAITVTVPESGRSRCDIDMTPMASLTGSVRTDERMVPDAQVTVLDAAGDLVAHVRTDEDGRYVVPGLDNGRYTVVASGYSPVTSRIVVSGDEAVHNVIFGYHDEADRA